MASQIGVMKIREQVDALEVMAVNPLAYLVAPRLVGIMLVLPALTIIAIFVMLSSAYLVAVHQLGLAGHEFIQFASESIEPIDFLYGAFMGYSYSSPGRRATSSGPSGRMRFLRRNCRTIGMSSLTNSSVGLNATRLPP